MDNIEQGLAAKVVDYITARGQDKLEKLDKEIAKLKNSANDKEVLDSKLLERIRIEELYIPENWLEDLASNCHYVKVVTHAPKYIHSSAKGSSGVLCRGSSVDLGYVSTASLNNIPLDFVCDAKWLPIAKLYQLDYEGVRFCDLILQNNPCVLARFAKNEEQARRWLAAFRHSIEPGKVASHLFLKQVYWPVFDDKDEYHLLAPLYATSLQHRLHQTVNSCKFSEMANQAKDAKKKELASENPVVYFVDGAEQHFGGTKPQNISQLNSQRYGKSHLLNSAGPAFWQSINKPPLNVKSIFANIMDNRAGKQATSLRWYLEHIFKRPSVMEIRDERAERIDQIIDILFCYVGEVHQFAPGWTASPECELPIEEQLLLDPKRRHIDKDFLLEWDKKDWPEQVAARFSRWLNRHIAGIKKPSTQLAPGQVEHVQWKTIVKGRLNVLKDDFSDFYLDDELEGAL